MCIWQCYSPNLPHDFVSKQICGCFWHERFVPHPWGKDAIVSTSRTNVLVSLGCVCILRMKLVRAGNECSITKSPALLTTQTSPTRTHCWLLAKGKVLISAWKMVSFLVGRGANIRGFGEPYYHQVALLPWREGCRKPPLFLEEAVGMTVLSTWVTAHSLSLVFFCIASTSVGSPAFSFFDSCG